MRQRKNRAFIYIKQHFIVWFRGEIKEKSFACQRQRNSDIDLNSLKPPNNCYFCKFIMFINALNLHKFSVINCLTSAPVIHAFYFQFWFFIHEVSCVRITLPLPENPAKFEWTWLIFCAVLHKLYTTICLWKDPMLWKTSADGFCSSAFLIDDSSWSWVHQNKKQRTNSSWLICGTIRKIEYESGKEKSDGCGVSLRRRARKWVRTTYEKNKRLRLKGVDRWIRYLGQIR